MPRIDLNFGKKNDEVETPEYLLEFIRKEFGDWEFDPCPYPKPSWDGLSVDWAPTNFVNPPFSNIRAWIQKGVDEMRKGKKSVFLLTGRVSSKYWFDLVYPNCTSLIVLEGGVVFKGYETRFPIPICLVEFDPAKPRANKKEEFYSGKLRIQRFIF